eukprot:Awhi_evm1s2349
MPALVHNMNKQKFAFLGEDHIENPADEILPGVWLGNHVSSGDENFLKANNITLIINATPDFPNHFLHFDHIKYVRIPIQNRDTSTNRTMFEELLEETLEEIRHNRALGNGTLVHCKSGHTRSATIVACFLVQFEKEFSLQKARIHIQEKRPTALHTKPHFYQPLQPLGRWRRKSIIDPRNLDNLMISVTN